MAESHSCACCGSDGGTEPTPTGVTCYCPIDGVIDVIGKRYGLQIVALLGAHGPIRYGQLEETLDVTSSSTLADRLAELVEKDLIERRSFDEVPPRVEYSLTPRGRELEARLQPLLAWASGDPVDHRPDSSAV